MFQAVLKEKTGQSFIEVILVIAIFAIVSTGVLSFLISMSQSAKQGIEFVVASGYIKEAMEAVRSVRDRNWSEITNGTHGLTTASGYYALNGSSDVLQDIYTRTITVEDVYRSGGLSGDIASTGVLDTNTKKITVNVAWNILEGKPQNMDAIFYVFNWQEQSWTQTLASDFEAGNENSTDITNAENGEVLLRGSDADWEGLEEYARFNLGGNGDRIAMVYEETQDLLYVLAKSTSGNDLEVFDVSNASGQVPSVARGFDLQNAVDVAIFGVYAYVATTADTEEVVIIDTRTMTRVGSVNIPGTENPTSVAVATDKLVIGRQQALEQELFLYSLENVASPVFLVATELTASVSDIVVSGTSLFVSSTNDMTEIFSVRLSDLLIEDTLDIEGTDDVKTLALRDGYLYAGLQNGTSSDFLKINISNPSFLIVESSLELGADIFSISIDSGEGFAFLGTSHDQKELMVIDLSSFSQTTSFDLVGTDSALSITMFGAYVYATSPGNNNELFLLRTGQGGWTNPARVGFADKRGTHNPFSLFVAGTTAYLGTQVHSTEKELFLYDISIPSSPTYLGSLEIGGNVNDLVVQGNYAYLATGQDSRELDIVDVSNKANPVRVGSVNLSSSKDALSVAVNGTTLYLGRDAGTKTGEQEFVVVDISTPSRPVFLGAIDFSDDINDLAAQGTSVYGATENNTGEFVVFNVSVRSSPFLTRSLDLSGTSDGETLAFSNNLIGLGRSGGEELALINVSNPLSPTISSQVDIASNVFGIAFEGITAVYLATDGSTKQFQRWNIMNPTQPVFETSFDMQAKATDIFFDGTQAFLSTEHDTMELQIIGQGAMPNGYAREGTFTSQVFDSGSSSTSWSSLEWTSSQTASVSFRIRSADTQAHLNTAVWVGPDGTISTFYTESGTVLTTDPFATGTRWIQWKASVLGDSSATPLLENVTLKYNP